MTTRQTDAAGAAVDRLDDERASAFIDALMDQPEREAFERELAEDPELAAELETFEQTIEVLRRMPQPAAPDDFLTAVQSRIRRRSRGRWFGIESARTRFPYEAAFNIVLIGILFALYLSSTHWGPSKLAPPRFSANAASESLAEAVPGQAIVGAPKVLTKADETPVRMQLVVKTAQLEAVTKTLAAPDSGWKVLSTTPGTDAGRTVMELQRIERGPPANR